MTTTMDSGKPFNGDARPALGADRVLGAVTSGAPPATSLPPRVSSHTLLGTAVEVQIDHHGVLYRLRRTAAGKLILTK